MNLPSANLYKPRRKNGITPSGIMLLWVNFVKFFSSQARSRLETIELNVENESLNVFP